MSELRVDIIQSWTPAEREYMRRRMPKTWALLSHVLNTADQRQREGQEIAARIRQRTAYAKRVWRMPFRLDRHHLVLRLQKQIACGTLKPARIPFDDILDTVSRVGGVPPAVIRAGSRLPEINAARMAVCYLAHIHGGLGFSAIGRALAIDHTTAWNAVWRTRSVLSGHGNKFTRRRDQALLNTVQRAEAHLL